MYINLLFKSYGIFLEQGMKCEQYWPDTGTSVCYDDVTVTTLNIEIFAEYTVRVLSVSKVCYLLIIAL